jgi:putative membrane protein
MPFRQPAANQPKEQEMSDKEKGGQEVERKKEDNQFTQELKLADKLAIERTILAADRTMLAGVRTSMSLIGFGFTIFNLLKYLQEHAPMGHIRTHTPRNIGAFMVLTGTVPLLFMIIQYYRTLKRMGRKESIFTNPNFQMAVTIFVLGAIMLLTLIANILVL